jgi:hypothetical protein
MCVWLPADRVSGAPIGDTNTAKALHVCTSARARHVPALASQAPALTEELATSDFFLYSPDGIGENEKADRMKEEDEEGRKAEAEFYSKRRLSSHW